MRHVSVSGPGLAPALASSGFSDHVELGEIGRIRLDPRVVMRIETLEGSPPAPAQGYWRGLAFDHFDGRSWSITPPGRSRVAGSAEGGVTFSHRPNEFDLVQRIVREPVQAGALFRSGKLRQLQGTVRRLERDTSDGLYAQGQADERLRYTVATRVQSFGDAALRRDRLQLDPRHPGRNLQLPPLDPGVAALARRIVAGLENDADRVRAGGAQSSPQADNTPASWGIRTRFMPRERASATACSPPAPPKATRVSPRGSCPRSREMTRRALAMTTSARRRMPVSSSP